MTLYLKTQRTHYLYFLFVALWLTTVALLLPTDRLCHAGGLFGALYPLILGGEGVSKCGT